MIHNCQIDPERFALISECTETYGMEDRDPENEWVWNVISRKTVAYSCGRMSREGEVIEHNHNPDEITLCQQLSKEAAIVMSGHFINMGDEGDHGFSPFYIVVNEGMPISEFI
jgi:hypothetical protein